MFTFERILDDRFRPMLRRSDGVEILLKNVITLVSRGNVKVNAK
jgi:hypothetical protein